MTINEIRQELIDENKNPDDYIILLNQNEYTIWRKDVAPDYAKMSVQQSQYGDKKVKADVDYLAIMTGVDINV